LWRGWRIGTEPAEWFRTRRALLDVIASNYPRPGDGIFAELHASKETIATAAASTDDFRHRESTPVFVIIRAPAARDD
jgi:hypothetical protein